MWGMEETIKVLKIHSGGQVCPQTALIKRKRINQSHINKGEMKKQGKGGAETNEYLKGTVVN